MSYLQPGLIVGILIGHASGLALGLWLRERHWRGIRERAGV